MVSWFFHLNRKSCSPAILKCCINSLQLKSIYLSVTPTTLTRWPPQQNSVQPLHFSTFPLTHLLLSLFLFLPTCSKWISGNFFFFFFPFIFGSPLETSRSLLLHAVCSEVQWAAQIRAQCVDVGSRSESGSVSGCRGPADSSPGKAQFSGINCLLLTTATIFPLWHSLYKERTIADVSLILCFCFFSRSKKIIWFFFFQFS